MSREQSGIRARRDEDLGRLLAQVRDRRPRVHCITNLAAGPDVANILLAAGAAPILAQAREEAGEIAAACSAAVLNFGTPDREKLEAIRAAGRRAKEGGSAGDRGPGGSGGQPLEKGADPGDPGRDPAGCDPLQFLRGPGAPGQSPGISRGGQRPGRPGGAVGSRRRHGGEVRLRGALKRAGGRGPRGRA